MKKAVLFLIFIGSFLFGREAVIKEILSENMIIMEQNGVSKRAKLAGIALFTKVNGKNRSVSYKERERLHAEAVNYILENMPVGSKIKFIKIDNAEEGAEYIWPIIGDQELNYLMVKNGYALLDANDPYLLGAFYMRLKTAMEYAKRKRFGLWRDNFGVMSSLVETRSYYGSDNKNVSKNDLLTFFKEKAK